MLAGWKEEAMDFVEELIDKCWKTKEEESAKEQWWAAGIGKRMHISTKYSTRIPGPQS